jgi:hypothetical protein
MDNVKMFQNIKKDLPVRLNNIAKYLPFFEICKLKKYNNRYDVGVLSMGILSYLLYEGLLKDKGLTFSEIQGFIKDMVEDYYGDIIKEDEQEELTRYMLNKLQNGGGPFNYTYYDVVKKQEVEKKIRYIGRTYDKSIEKNLYKISSEGVDFFLQTKEFGEESKITITLLILRKLVDNGDFDSAINALSNLNIEIRKEIKRKAEILEELSYYSFEGYDAYTKNVRLRLEEENQLFKDTINSLNRMEKEYLQKIDKEQISEKEMKLKVFVTDMKIELNKSVDLHSKLLGSVVDLRNKADEILSQRRRNILRENLNFMNLLDKSIKEDNANNLARACSVLFNPKINKTFPVGKINDLFLWRKPKEEEAEEVESEKGQAVEYIKLDDVIEDRILNNTSIFFKELLFLLIEYKEIDLNFYMEALSLKYGEEILYNGDFTSFVVTLSRVKGAGVGYKEYSLKNIEKGSWDTLDNEIIFKTLVYKYSELEVFKSSKFICQSLQGEYASFNGIEITNFKYMVI